MDTTLEQILVKLPAGYNFCLCREHIQSNNINCWLVDATFRAGPMIVLSRESAADMISHFNANPQLFQELTDNQAIARYK